MHLMIPNASALDEAARHALASLALPNLAAQLARLSPAETWGSDELSAQPPHHLAEAALRQQAAPSAAAWAVDAGPELAWALMSPVHLAVGTDGVDVLPPAALQLSESDAARIVGVLRELWSEAEGWQWRLLDATRWAIGHASALDGLSAASIERAAGRPIEPWLPDSRVLRRWQNEAQMLLHGHALNLEREARGEPAVNSVWIGDIGRSSGRAADVTVDARLTEPLQNGDLAAWVEAWQRLDAGPLSQPLTNLTLCGERFARRFTAQPLSLLARLRRRFQSSDVAAVLEAL
ncbi:MULTISPECIES: hypothetical protein [unclassified Roseateles]|uniref:hypothetical protein n=1 Tax=unclassified Roseateles TaxID=2626991 RepID=UPI0006F710DA|nr:MULTISPECIES: hypothetical protein [unclassified Roseateles]KQW52075.1 hypothetical protein ASC81_05630 [Pelomonas sp. Root405]KRA78309.1 hypothetical protein ASD88_05635 [Pelomonas sp. Root662]